MAATDSKADLENATGEDEVVDVSYDGLVADFFTCLPTSQPVHHSHRKSLCCWHRGRTQTATLLILAVHGLLFLFELLGVAARGRFQPDSHLAPALVGRASLLDMPPSNRACRPFNYRQAGICQYVYVKQATGHQIKIAPSELCGVGMT